MNSTTMNAGKPTTNKHSRMMAKTSGPMCSELKHSMLGSTDRTSLPCTLRQLIVSKPLLVI